MTQSTNNNNYTGAKWWKFDFHTHTPASMDFMEVVLPQDAEVTPKFWLQKFIDKGIDCVAITDHNSGKWIDKLKRENNKLENPLTLFPGVEISVNGGVHILALFDPKKTTADIDSLLGAVEYSGTKGCSDNDTSKSLTEVIDIITQHNGIAIPAHADKEKGLFKLKGNTLEQALENNNIHAMELCESDYQKPQLYIDKKLQWSEVLGSDTHSFESENFGNFTWIKMDAPSINGLKLALIDGKVSVNRNMQDNPNQHADYIIENISINKAKYMGRQESLECKFSPFLNAIIGGRGSGKSTLLEFMRFTLRRHKETPDAIKDNKYFQVGGDNLLTHDSKLSLIYKKGDVRYRLSWSDGSAKSLEVKNNNEWQTEEGEISSLFPVQIYSQKQIFELAKNPEALLDIIDKDERVKFSDFNDKQKQLLNKYKQIAQKISQTREKIAQKNKLTGELKDLTRQIEQIEKSGHKTVLQNYRQHQTQLNTIKNIEIEWQENTDLLNQISEDIIPSDIVEDIFVGQDAMLKSLQKSNDKWQKIHKQIKTITTEAKTITTDWQQEKQQALWMKDLKSEMSKYEQIKTQLTQQGIDPEKYPFLLMQQAQKQKDLGQISNYESELIKLKADKKQIFIEIEENRGMLTTNRERFLVHILQNNSAVNIKVEPFGEDIKSVEKMIRKILHCEYKYYKDINSLMDIYKNKTYKELKNAVGKIYNGNQDAKDNRFYTHLQNLTQESIFDFKLWFPKDNLKITFGSQHQQLKDGSPGQKSAALLAFILSYGNEPLLLDQPEDDLDNELIYNLIVKQIRATKNKRQIIIVTHNANIVVNGDAEMVLPMSVGGGQSYIEESASIQNKAIREKICSVLEGGEQAFSQRYKRIHLEE